MVVDTIYHTADGQTYDFEDSATADEKEAVRAFGVKKQTEVKGALNWYDAVQSASSIDDLRKIKLGKHPADGTDIPRPNRNGSKCQSGQS